MDIQYTIGQWFPNWGSPNYFGGSPDEQLKGRVTQWDLLCLNLIVRKLWKYLPMQLYTESVYVESCHKKGVPSGQNSGKSLPPPGGVTSQNNASLRECRKVNPIETHWKMAVGITILYTLIRSTHITLLTIMTNGIYSITRYILFYDWAGRFSNIHSETELASVARQWNSASIGG